MGMLACVYGYIGMSVYVHVRARVRVRVRVCVRACVCVVQSLNEAPEAHSQSRG